MDVSNLTTAEKWDYIFSSLGIKDFMDFLMSSDLQNDLLPLKIFFIAFSLIFLFFTLYFYINSSYIKYKFGSNVADLLSEGNPDASSADGRWRKIIKKAESGNEKDYKLAIIDADDLMQEVMKEAGFKGEDFDELIEKVERKLLPNYDDLLKDHEIRNEIVYNLEYKLDFEEAKKILADYESAIKNLSV